MAQQTGRFRGIWMRCGRRGGALVATLAVALCLTIEGAPAARSQTAGAPEPSAGVPVTPCPAQLALGPGATPPPEPAVPRTLALPPVTLPSGAALYGTPQTFGPPVVYSLAPAGYKCAATQGADGSFFIDLTAPGAAAPALSYTYSAGGIGVNVSAACGYFRALRTSPYLGGPDQCYPPPTGEIVRQIATGTQHLWAAATVDPPGVLPPKEDPSHGRDTSLGMVVADEGNFQAADCILPPGQRQLCLAGLSLFVDQSTAARSGPASLAAVQAGTKGLSSQAASEDCPAAVDVTLEREIDRSGDLPITIPGESVDTPAGLSGVVRVDFVPGDATVCDSGLTAGLKTPDGFDQGTLSLQAAIAGQPPRGPFTYSADATAWTSVPGAPSGQPLVTQFDPLSVEAAVDPHLSIDFKAGGAEPSLDIAHVTISAVRQAVTLVGPSGPLLRVALGPSLELSVGIEKKDAEEKVKDAESQGEDEATAEADVADQISGDAAVGIDEAASEFDGLDISGQVSQELFDQLQGALVDAFEADPALVVFVPTEADAVPSEVTADEAAAIDAETAADVAVDVDASEVLVDLFVFVFI